MSLLDLSNELLFLIAANLDRPRDVNSLLSTNRRLSHLLQSQLHDLAVLEKDGLDALLWGALHGHEGLIRLTLSRGVSVDKQSYTDDCDGKTALYRSVQSGNLSAVKLLVSHGARLDLFTLTYATPLHEAAAYGTPAMASLLLGLGYSVAETDDHFSTPLHWAAANKRADTLHVLLTRTPPDTLRECINTIDISGNTALHAVLALTTHPSSTPPDPVAQLLITHGASVDATNSAGYSPLGIAAALGLHSSIALLFTHGADPVVSRYPRRPPLHEAATAGALQTAACLLDGGASATYMDLRGSTPIDLAYIEGHAEMVELLLRRSEGISMAAGLKLGVLVWAASMGMEAVVLMLLQRGIAEFVERTEGESMLIWAEARGETMIARVLREIEGGVDM